MPTRSLPWSWYADEAVLRTEQERICRRAWQYAGRLRRSRRRDASLPPPRRVRAAGELEDRLRELPRVLPLRRRPPGLQRHGRRGPRRVPAGGEGRRLDAARPAAGER